MRWSVLACIVTAGCFTRPEPPGTTPPPGDGRLDDGGGDGGGECTAGVVNDFTAMPPPADACRDWGTTVIAGNDAPMVSWAPGKMILSAGNSSQAACQSNMPAGFEAGFEIEIAGYTLGGMPNDEVFLEVTASPMPVRISIAIDQGFEQRLVLSGSSPATSQLSSQPITGLRLVPVGATIVGAYESSAGWVTLGSQPADSPSMPRRLSFGAAGGGASAELQVDTLRGCPE